MIKTPSAWAYLHIAFCALMLGLAGCNGEHSADRVDANTLKIGFLPGPYRDEFEQGIEPQLIARGYRIEYVDFSDGLACNDALARGEIDANVMQHRTYLESTNARNGTDLVPLVQVPTPPMALFSARHQDLRVTEGATVIVPDTAVNLLRALRIMRAAGWLDFDQQADPATISEHQISSNPHRIRLIELDAAQAPRSLKDADYVAIQGNFVISSGLKLEDALALEKRDDDFINVVAVNAPQRDSDFAKALIEAYHAPFFRQAIDANPDFAGYMPPDYFAAQ